MFDKILQNKYYRKYREILLCIIDTCLVLASFAVAFWSHEDFSFSNLSTINAQKVVNVFVIVAVVYIINFAILKIYKSLWKYVGPAEVARLATAVCSSSIVLMFLVIILKESPYYFTITFVGGLLSLLTLLCLRLGYRLLRRASLPDKASLNALIIGAGDGGYLLQKELVQNVNANVRVIGFVDDYKKGKVISGTAVIGTIAELPMLIQKYEIDVAYIAIPSANKDTITYIYGLCEAAKITVKIMKQQMVSDSLVTKSLPVEDISLEDLLGRGEIHLNQTEIKAYLTDQKVLVTGAGGSIGSELCRQILKFGPKQLIMLDINENGLYMLEQEFNRDREHGRLASEIEIRSYITSIRDREAIDDVMDEIHPDVVYHAAAHKHVPLMETKPKEAIKNNVFGTNNVIQSCIQHKIKRFILISTDKAVNPTNVMGATKRFTEMILQAYGDNGVTKLAAVRFGNVLGSNGSVVPIFKNQIKEGGPLTITDKKILRYFMTIPEAAQLVLQAGFYANQGEIFVLDMGKPVKILELAEKMIRLTGNEPYKDIDIKEIGLRPGEKMFEELRLDNESVVKTKNDLIFVNKPMHLSKTRIVHELNALQKRIKEENEVSGIKQQLFTFIKDDTVCEDSIS